MWHTTPPDRAINDVIHRLQCVQRRAVWAAGALRRQRDLSRRQNVRSLIIEPMRPVRHVVGVIRARSDAVAQVLEDAVSEGVALMTTLADSLAPQRLSAAQVCA